jgi:hypothetical protein
MKRQSLLKLWLGLTKAVTGRGLQQLLMMMMMLILWLTRQMLVLLLLLLLLLQAGLLLPGAAAKGQGQSSSQRAKACAPAAANGAPHRGVSSCHTHSLSRSLTHSFTLKHSH